MNYFFVKTTPTKLIQVNTRLYWLKQVHICVVSTQICQVQHRCTYTNVGACTLKQVYKHLCRSLYHLHSSACACLPACTTNTDVCVFTSTTQVHVYLKHLHRCVKSYASCTYTCVNACTHIQLNAMLQTHTS